MKFKQNLAILSAILITVLILSSGCIPTAPTTPGRHPQLTPELLLGW